MTRILITAGPTHEPIDAVRYIGNRSSGRMGTALAETAAARGHHVTLLLGPAAAQPPTHSSIVTHRFRTTAELQALLRDHWPQSDLLIMAAAVADYRPKTGGGTSKLRRSEAGLTLELEATPDLVAEAARSRREGQRIIGLALEADEPPDAMVAAARAKLARKGLDAIVANPLGTMDGETVRATLVSADGRTTSPAGEMSKVRFAEWLLDALALGSSSDVKKNTHPGAKSTRR